MDKRARLDRVQETLREGGSTLVLVGRRLYCQSVWCLGTPALAFFSAVVLTFVCPASAWAQAEVSTPGLRVEVRREGGALACPDSGWFQERLGERRGGGGQRGIFTVELSHEGDRLRATIQRWHEQSRAGAARELSDADPSCDALAAAVVATLAILAEDFAREKSPPPSKPAPLPLPHRVRGGEAQKRQPLLMWAGAGAGIAGAFISPIAPTLAVGISLDSRHLRQSLRLTMTTQQQSELAPGSVVVQAWLATMLSCFRVEHRAAGAALCAAFDAGRLHATSEGVTETGSAASGYEALGLEGHASWGLTRRLRVSTALGCLVPFSRQSFSIVGLGAAYEPPAVTWRSLFFVEYGVF